jgi:S-formylglutathione hydrolase FrmB
MNIDKSKFLSRLWTASIFLFAAFSGYSQTPDSIQINKRLLTEPAKVILLQIGSDQHHSSKLMAREMSYRVILPSDYKNSNETTRYSTIYLLHGLTGNYANWTDKTKLTEYAAKNKFIIVTPDGANGWYADSVSASNDKYESYIIKELIPEIDKQFRTVAERRGRVIAGLSMGGYGAIKFGLKYPEMFSLAGSFSGALGATNFTEKNAGNIGKGIDAIFGPEAGEMRKANDIFAIIRDSSAEKIKAMPYIYQSCGTEDFLIQNNRDFLALLNEKKVPHEYRELPGGHTWTFWDDQVREFLTVADRMIKK